jgi:hypothetical protein
MDTALVHQQAAWLDMEGCGMNIKELAEQAGMLYMDYIRVDSINQLEKFAELVATHEREECAKVCEKQIKKENLLKTGDDQTLSNLLIGHRVTAHMTDARLIRERGKV